MIFQLSDWFPKPMIFNSYSSRTRRIWADIYIYNQRGRRPSWLLGTFRSDYEYEYEYEYDFWAREAWVLAVVDTVVAVVSSQQKYFSNFCEYEVITFCQSRECLVYKQHKMS